MNKKVFGRKLSRSRPAREALFASLTRSLILNGKTVTTKAKAKAVVSSVEKMITLAKKGGLNGRRSIFAALDNSKEATEVLFNQVVKSFPAKNSGFIRMISLPRRRGDNAQMTRLEWTEKMETVDVEKKSDKKGEKKADPKKEVKSVKKTVKKEVKKEKGK